MECKKIEDFNLKDIIVTALKVPGVKVNRDAFLMETFSYATSEERANILANGPVGAGISREKLYEHSSKIIENQAVVSTAASFVAGLPGGLTGLGPGTAVDAVTYFGTMLRMAQEIAYLYGEQDLWDGDVLSSDRIDAQLIGYLGMMYDIEGDVDTIIKGISEAFLKDNVIKGASKIVPVVGGIISGAMTYNSFGPMGRKLLDRMDEETFGEKDDIVVDADIEIVENSKEEKLKKANELYEAGVITESEYTRIRNRIEKNA